MKKEKSALALAVDARLRQKKVAEELKRLTKEAESLAVKMRALTAELGAGG